MGPQVGGGERERTVGRCAREKTSEAENRESGGIRALISVLGPSRGDEKGGANSRDINSVLALGGLQRRKLRAEGEYYPVPPPLLRIPLLPASLSHRRSSPPFSAVSTNVTTLRAREGGKALQIRD